MRGEDEQWALEWILAFFYPAMEGMWLDLKQNGLTLTRNRLNATGMFYFFNVPRANLFNVDAQLRTVPMYAAVMYSHMRNLLVQTCTHPQLAWQWP